ncbi:MAG: amidohydrolase family protein [Candidatus Aminicenantes bacterium]|nr:amidohydrolase family protein [Candidatus Aminicenantes bacterium]
MKGKQKGASVLWLILAFLLVLGCPRQKSEASDMILLNGNIWTVNPDQPWAEAVALEGGRILQVGSTSEIKKLAGAKTQIIDLKGDLVLPGFIDSHTHFLDGGFSLPRINLREARSKEEFIERIQNKAKELEKGAWILDGNWDHQQFIPPELPRKDWIDEVTPHNPVSVNRYDGHMVLTNSLALKMAGIAKETPSPQGGEILKDATTGEPTGILRDAAMELVQKHVPEPSFQQKIEAAEMALKNAAEVGLTSIHDMASVSSFEVYQELHRLNNLTARLSVYIPITEVETYARLKSKTPFGNEFLKIGGLKGFVDGSLGSSTALFFEPYTDDSEKYGLLYSHMYPEGIMKKRLMLADQSGLQVAIHAIGDKANHIILDIFEEVAAQQGEWDRRWRIEHAQHLLPEDIERMGKLKIIASVQPYHAIDDGRWAEKKIGKKRCQYTFAFQSLLEKGVLLACGSDWYIAPLDPLAGIYAAVTRQTTDGKNPQGWMPKEKISLEEAIKGYTLNGAYTEFSEEVKGSIESGKVADLVVLDQNIFKIPPEDIKKAKVKMTIMDGKIVYRR